MTDPRSQQGAPAASEGETKDLPLLRSLGGERAAADLGPSLAKLLLLPDRASEHFSEVLQIHLADDAPNDKIEVAVRRFCRTYEAEPDHVYGAVQACRILLRGAARWNVSAQEFVEDLAALVPEKLRDPIVDRVGAYYNSAFSQLRELAAVRSLVEHSQVVRGISWRVDVLKHSEHAMNMDVPVATLTLKCQHANEEKTLSVQLLPTELASLRDTCNKILS